MSVIGNAVSSIFGGGAQPPKAPSAGQVLAQQNAQNTKSVGTQISQNRINQSNPYGNIQYTPTGQKDAMGNPIYSQNTQYSAPQQGILNNLQNNQLLQGLTQTGLIGNNFGQYAGNTGQSLQQQQMATTANNLGLETSFLQPFFETQQRQLDNQLRNQGLDPNSQGPESAYNIQMRNLGTTQGGVVKDFLANQWNQNFGQALQTQQAPLNYAQQLQNLSQPVNLSGSFPGVPGVNVPTVDVNQISNTAFQNQMQAYNAKLAQQQAILNGLGSTVGSVFGGPIGGAIGGSLFGSTSPGTAANGGWQTTTTPSNIFSNGIGSLFGFAGA